MLKDFSVESPYLLVLVLAVPVLWYLAGQFRQYRRKNIQLFGGSATIEGQGGLVTKSFWMFLLGVFLLAIAATNPRLKGQPKNVTRKGGDVIFALDVSKSMLAEDVKPNRLERAKLVCLNLLQGFDNQRVAVVVFAGDAYVTMPFSTNYAAVSAFVDEANPEQVSAQGSDYVNLIETLIEFFGKDKLAQRGVVVLSDGEDHSQLTKADVRKATEAGLIFYTVGIGTTKGAPIPDGRGYLQDRSGNKVISKLHSKPLKILAGTKGKYFNLSDSQALLNAIRHLRESKFSDLKSYEYTSLFQFFLLPGLLLIFLYFWRGMAVRKHILKATVVVGILLGFTGEALAQKSHEELLKGDQAFEKQKYDDAAKWYGAVATDDTENTQAIYNKGVAEAKMGKKKEALQDFAKAAELADNQKEKAASLYNAGTLLLSEKGQLDKSIEWLKEALRNSPNDMDIRKNLAKAIQLKRSQQRQNQQNKNQNKDQKKDNKDQDQQQNQDQKKDNKDQNQQQNKDQKKDNKDQNQQQNQDQKKDNKDQNQSKNQQKQEENQGDSSKDDQKMNNNHQKTSTEKPISIKKQKALQKLKMVDEEERKVRKKLQRLKGKSARRSGKNW